MNMDQPQWANEPLPHQSVTGRCPACDRIVLFPHECARTKQVVFSDIATEPEQSNYEA